MYQRWLYQDYVAYWHDQSAVTKQLWETNARRYHMTGFAYWMRYHLANLPDIAASYHLDYITNSSVIDFSKNANHGTVYGAIPADGVIDKALFFDGLDDYVNCGHGPSLNPSTALTLEAFINILGYASTNYCVYLGKYSYFAVSTGWLADSDIRFSIWDSDGVGHGASFVNPPWNTPLHVVGTWDSALPSDNIRLYINGKLETWWPESADIRDSASVDLLLGAGHGFNHCLIDHAVIYNRALTPADIKRHSERRYPL